MPITNVPNMNGKTTEEKVAKLTGYMQTVKRDVEYELSKANQKAESSTTSLEGLLATLDTNQEDLDKWKKILENVTNLGQLIGSAITDNIDNANILISSLKDKNIMLMDGNDIKDSTWAMELSPAGFRIASEKTHDEATDTYAWKWSTFGTGKGFTADNITAGTIQGLTIKACDLITTNMTSGTIQGVQIEGNTITGNTITGNTIRGGTIQGSTITGNTITGGTIQGAEITGGTITGGTLNASVINSSVFNTATLNAPAISAAAITGGTITGNTITGGSITGANITGNTITGGSITGATITGGQLAALGDNGDGVLIKDIGYAVYGATEDGAGELAAYLQYDQDGRGTIDEAHKRVFLKTCNGYALKIFSDGDMSIEANGTIFEGDVRFMGKTNLGLLLNTSIEWKDDGCIVNGEHYIQITDTAIKCLDTNDKVTITSSGGTVAAAYQAAKASTSSEGSES